MINVNAYEIETAPTIANFSHTWNKSLNLIYLSKKALDIYAVTVIL
jgi:hypothetical protein